MKKNTFLFLFLLFFVCLVSCKSTTHETYSSDLLGLQLVIPSDWDFEETDRFLSLMISPSSSENKDFVSINIFQNSNVERDLSNALEEEVNHLKDRWSLDEIAFVKPIEESTLNGFEVAKVTIEAPVQSQNEERKNNSSTFQPMDVMVLDAGDRFIVIIFRKSTINPDLNDEGQNIINSIRAYP
ncbi:MAG: hypothetical protein QNJ45_05305 [Ardenticatenaceae bacterium]|nr:hypothetical protein [Ardenticatenaceae bacterium]